MSSSSQPPLAPLQQHPPPPPTAPPPPPPTQQQQHQQHHHQQHPHHPQVHPHPHAESPLDPRLASSATPTASGVPSSNNHVSPAASSSTGAVSAAYPTQSQYPEITHHRPPIHHYSPGSNIPKADSGAGSTYTSPQPYFHYASPHSGGTPHGQHSNQASPDSYPLPADHASPDQADGQNPDDAKRPRACEACRGLKVRCDQDPAHPEIPCKRCAKAGRPCVITQPSRKRQKKADSRVAELEKKLDALTSVLQQQQTLPPGGHPYAAFSAGGPPPAPQSAPPIDARQYQSPNGQLPPPPPRTFTHPPPSAPAPLAHRVPSYEAAHKRRRTEDNVAETPTLDGADESVPVPHLPPSPHSSRQAMGEQYRNHHDPWGPNADIKRYLDRSPQELSNRVDSLIPPDLAATIFNRFVTHLAPYLPVVVFPANTTADQVRKEKPILYTCILSAAAFGTLHPDVSKQMNMEAVGAIADSVVRNGNKSLELVQALQILALWYRPPEKAEQTNFYQIIHMAAAMALDIGLGKNFNPSKARRGFGGPYHNLTPQVKALQQDSDSLDARRAWLGCYYLCASASMVLRRPNMVRWSNYMKECIEVLESAPEALPSDRLLCQHIKISRICEDIGLQFLMDDSTASVNIQDPKVTYQLNILECQLRSWKEGIPPECRAPSLDFFEHVTNLYLHEIVLHLNHNVDDFKLPFTEESLKTVSSTSDALTQHQMAALEACQRAAHGILDTMLSFEIQVVRALPMLIFVVRCIYAVVILIKMHVAITTPGSELAKFMKPEDLRVDYYLDRLLLTYRQVASHENFDVDSKIVRILSVLREWYVKHMENIEARARGEPLPHRQNSQPTDPPPSDSKSEENQTPLHLLSQVATGRPTGNPSQHQQQQQQQQPPQQQQQAQSQPPPPSQQQMANRNGPESQNWTFNTPFVMDYSRLTDPRMPGPQHPPGVAPSYPPVSEANGNGYIGPIDQGVMDGNDFGWGSGFEQAMDIAMGGVDGLAGGGLDPWFLGDAMAPFGFNGDVPATAGQW